MRLGIFGGTFNPIHNGHTALASYFKEMLGLDEIAFVPTGIPPHKDAPELESVWDRFYMTDLALNFDENMYALDWEIKRAGESKTYDTLELIKEEYPGWEYYLLMGSDMFFTFEEWYKFEEIMDAATLCTVPRHEGEREALIEHGQKLGELGADVFVGNPDEIIDISSSEIRKSIKEHGESIQHLNKKVWNYISTLGLYGAKRDEELESYHKLAAETLEKRRLTHSENVSKTSLYLASLYGADPKKAYTAGLLHDLFKVYTPEEMLQKTANSDIILGSLKNYSSKIWHGPLVAGYLLEKEIITDTETLDAIRNHTVGRSGMTTVEKIVYVADAVSPEREYESVSEIRDIAKISLEMAVLEISAFSIEKLIKDKEKILNETVATYNEALEQIKTGKV